MSVYLIANLEIHDRDEYTQYESGFLEIFGQYEGKLVAVDEDQRVLEGDWPFTRTVLIEFPSEGEALRWYESPAYQELARHRWAASKGSIAMVKGLS